MTDEIKDTQPLLKDILEEMRSGFATLREETRTGFDAIESELKLINRKIDRLNNRCSKSPQNMMSLRTAWQSWKAIQAFNDFPAIIYARVSTSQQERDGSSLDSQLAACKKYAKQHKYSTLKVVSESHTGADLWDRPGISQARELIRARKVAGARLLCDRPPEPQPGASADSPRGSRTPRSAH